MAPELRALKGRVCYRGDSAKTAEGKLALYQTLAASPASIVAANSVISFGLFEGHKLSSADAVKAYLQSELKSLAATYIRLPRELWPESWFTPSGYPRFKRPIIRLRKSLYGHPEAGAHWQQFLEEQLCLLGAVKVEEFASTFTIPTFGGLALVVYVDDLILSGPSQWHEPFWEALGEKVLIDDIGPLGRFLGRHHSTVEVDNTEFFGFDMRAYAEATVQEYLRVANSPKMKVVASPFLSKGFVGAEERGALASSASSILMRLMWLARLARPDLLRVVTWLATMVQSWTQACDAYLYRAMCYLECTKNAMLLGHVRDAPEHVFVELFADADYCGDDEHTHSTTGGWLQLSGPRTSFPLAWLSKKQTATCRSTTEAETVALSYVLFEEGLPLVELYAAMLGRPVLLRLREDNTACAKVVTAGYSKKLRHLKRVHRVSLASVKEQLDRDDVELSLVGWNKRPESRCFHKSS